MSMLGATALIFQPSSSCFRLSAKASGFSMLTRGKVTTGVKLAVSPVMFRVAWWRSTRMIGVSGKAAR